MISRSTGTRLVITKAEQNNVCKSLFRNVYEISKVINAPLFISSLAHWE